MQNLRIMQLCSISDILTIFETFGFPGIIALCIILILWYLIQRGQKQAKSNIDKGFEQLTTAIISNNDKLLEAITESNKQTQSQLFDIINKSMDKSLTSHDKMKSEQHTQSLLRRLEVSEYISDILWELMTHYNAQRTVLIEFHNSKENLNGLSFLWYDIQYEKQEKGVSTISHKCRNLQASNLLPIIKMVNNSPSNIAILHEEDIEAIYEKSTVLYNQFKEINVNHIIYCGIYSEENALIGMIALEYQEGHPYHEDMVNLFDIKEKASTIALLLNFNANSIANSMKETNDEQ